MRDHMSDFCCRLLALGAALLTIRILLTAGPALIAGVVLIACLGLALLTHRQAGVGREVLVEARVWIAAATVSATVLIGVTIGELSRT